MKRNCESSLSKLSYHTSRLIRRLEVISNLIEESSIDFNGVDFVEWIHQELMDIDILKYCLDELLNKESKDSKAKFNNPIGSHYWEIEFERELDKAIRDCSNVLCEYIKDNGYNSLGEYLCYIKSEVFPSIRNCMESLRKYF